MMKRVVIGLTGMMGSGKSAVASIFRELGAEVIDTDRIVHELYRRNWILRAKIVRRFGLCVMNWDLSISRKRLGEIVFRDEGKMRELEELVWPYIDRAVESKLGKTEGFVVIEAPLMKKAGAERFMDVNILVSAPEKLRRARLRKAGMDNARMEQIGRLQKSIIEGRKDYDYVISNDSGIDELRGKVRKLWKEIGRKYRENITKSSVK